MVSEILRLTTKFVDSQSISDRSTLFAEERTIQENQIQTMGNYWEQRFRAKLNTFKIITILTEITMN